jgi:hypothetical protein
MWEAYLSPRHLSMWEASLSNQASSPRSDLRPPYRGSGAGAHSGVGFPVEHLLRFIYRVIHCRIGSPQGIRSQCPDFRG